MFGFSRKRQKPKSGQAAKERLQILLAHERGAGKSPDYLPLLQQDILEAIRRHVHVDQDAVDIRMERADELSSLEINIDLPGNLSPASENNR